MIILMPLPVNQQRGIVPGGVKADCSVPSIKWLNECLLGAHTHTNTYIHTHICTHMCTHTYVSYTQ